VEPERDQHPSATATAIDPTGAGDTVEAARRGGRSDDELAYLLGLSFQLLISEFTRRLGEVGYGDLRPVHGFVFQTLTPDGATATEVAQVLGITKQATGQLLDQLELLGYVRREPHPLGGRRRLVVLTDRGEEHMKVAGSTLRQLEAEWTEQIGPDRMAELRQILTELVDANQPDGGRPPFRPVW
jgi:DNA-binding MarR family transcriptional regulator